MYIKLIFIPMKPAPNFQTAGPSQLDASQPSPRFPWRKYTRTVTNDTHDYCYYYGYYY